MIVSCPTITGWRTHNLIRNITHNLFLHHMYYRVYYLYYLFLEKLNPVKHFFFATTNIYFYLFNFFQLFF